MSEQRPDIHAPSDYIFDCVSDYFTAEANDDNYRISSSLAMYWIVTKPELNGLIYPSMMAKADSDNFALKPSWVANGLQFHQAEYFTLNAYDEASVNTTTICTATKLDSDGRFIWNDRHFQFSPSYFTSATYTVRFNMNRWEAVDDVGNVFDVY